MLWWEDCCWTQWREGWRVLHSGEIGRLPQSSSKNTSNLNWDWICKASCACILLFPALTLIQKRNSLEPMEVLPHGSAHTCASTSTFWDQYFLHLGTSSFTSGTSIFTSGPIFSCWNYFDLIKFLQFFPRPFPVPKDMVMDNMLWLGSGSSSEWWLMDQSERSK